MSTQYPHRGRFQAQGGGIEESEPWAQNDPLTKADGVLLLNQLREKLSPSELKIRYKAFQKAEAFIFRASQNGGVDSPIIKSFRVKGSRDERVDLEVRNGKAFIPVQ